MNIKKYKNRMKEYSYISKQGVFEACFTFCTFSQEIKILIYIYTLKRVNLFEFFHALNLFGLINFVSYVEDSSCTQSGRFSLDRYC